MYDVGNSSTGDPEVVNAITTTLRDAGRAVGQSVEGVVGMFHDDESTVLFDYLSPGLTTLSELRETAGGLANATDVVCLYPNVTVRVLSDDFAFSLADSHTEAHLPDGTLFDVNTRVTNIWQRIDGTWRCIHEHSSVPVDVATGQVDLHHPIP